MDGQWIDEFHHAIHSVLTGETDGYYEDFGSLEHVERAFRDTYVYNGVYSPHRNKIFGVPVGDNNYGKFVVFAQNHDHIGNRALGDRLTTNLTTDELKLAAALVILSPYVPLLFMGEEYGEKNPFLYFTSHSDPESSKGLFLKAGRKSLPISISKRNIPIRSMRKPLKNPCCHGILRRMKCRKCSGIINS